MPKAAIIGSAIKNKNPRRLGNKKTATTGQEVRCKLFFFIIAQLYINDRKRPDR